MKEKFINFIPVAQRIVLSGCIFIVPLIFLTDFTKNPFIVQDLFLALLLCGALILFAAEVFLKRTLNLKISKIDLFVLFFAAVSLMSLFYNLLFDGKFFALIGEFSQKSDVFVFSFLGAWFLAKYAAESEAEKFRPQFYLMVFLWCLCWLPFKLFGGVFLCGYVVLMLCWGVYICFKRLNKITLFSISDIFIAVCAVCCFYGILQNAGIEPVWKININAEFGSRAISTFGNPNFLSSYLVLFLPLVFLRFMKAKTGGEQFTFFTVLGLFCAYLAISMTRSSWLAVAVAGAFLLCFKNFRALLLKSKGKTIFIIIFCCMVFFLWPSYQKEEKSANYSSAAAERIQELSVLTGKSALGLNAPADKINFAYHQRLMMWVCGFKMFKESPLIGKGMTSFQMNYGLCQGGLMFKNPALGELKTQANEAHNQFIQVLAENGLIGLMAFILLIFGGIMILLKNIRQEQKDINALTYLCLTGGLVAFIADNMLNITFHAVVTAFAFWFVFSLLNNTCCQQVEKKLKIFQVLLILSGSLILAFVFAYWQTDYFYAESQALKGYKALVRGDRVQAVNLLMKADKNSAVRADASFAALNALIQENKIKEAQEIAERGIRKFPGYYEFYLRYSGLKSASGDNKAAAESLANALGLYPANMSAARAWAGYMAAIPALQTPQNTELAKKLLNVFPYNQDIEFAYITGVYAQGDYKSACDRTYKDLKFDSLNPDFYNIAVVCAGKGLGDSTFLGEVSALRQARAELKKGNADISLENKIKDLYAKYGNNAAAGLLLAELYFNKGDYKASISVLEPYYKENKYFKPLCFALSSAYQKAGMYDKAKEILSSVISYDKNDEQALLRLKSIDNFEKNALQTPLN